MWKIGAAALVAIALLPDAAVAKGEGVGLWMEGKVSDVEKDGEAVHLLVTGRFWLDQYRGRERHALEVTGPQGQPATIPATLTQARPFFAMATDWRAGAIREEGALAAMVEEAARREWTVRFEFEDAQLAFGRDGGLTVIRGNVVRATDHDLR